MKKIAFLSLFVVFLLFLGCSSTKDNAKTAKIVKENATCTFKQSDDQIVINNQDKNYVLYVYLYGNKLKDGNYQVLGSDLEPLLEGAITRDNVTQDLKTTLFVTKNGDVISVHGSAQLYFANSYNKSGEIFDFAYDGNLTIEN